MLNEHRTHPLPEGWWPVSVFSTFTDKDTTTVLDWDGAWGVTYRCEETGNVETLDLRDTSAVKLPWRVDWPMRWALEGVDFEPAGKDHHSEGGSFDTSKHVVRVFGGEPPVTFQYDFIRIKGRGGKISSSSGEVISLKDVLEIYPPEIIRYLFVSTRPNTEFAISFDLDVLKIYEDYDKCERVYYGMQEISEKKREKERRIYELSQVHGAADEMPYQVALRHLCNMLQSNSGDIDAVISSLPDVSESQIPKLRNRCECAWNWITAFALRTSASRSIDQKMSRSSSMIPRRRHSLRLPGRSRRSMSIRRRAWPRPSTRSPMITASSRQISSLPPIRSWWEKRRDLVLQGSSCSAVRIRSCPSCRLYCRSPCDQILMACAVCICVYMIL